MASTISLEKRLEQLEQRVQAWAGETLDGGPTTSGNTTGEDKNVTAMAALRAEYEGKFVISGQQMLVNQANAPDSES